MTPVVDDSFCAAVFVVGKAKALYRCKAFEIKPTMDQGFFLHLTKLDLCFCKGLQFVLVSWSGFVLEFGALIEKWMIELPNCFVSLLVSLTAGCMPSVFVRKSVGWTLQLEAGTGRGLWDDLLTCSKLCAQLKYLKYYMQMGM